MNLYKMFKTDEHYEKEGIDLIYGDNSKGNQIRIKVARAGGANVKYAKALERRTKPYRRQIQNETIDPKFAEQLIMETFAESVILGWDGVEDEEGNDMPFSFENCIKLFTDLPDLWADVQAQSQKVALFRQEVREEDLKN